MRIDFYILTETAANARFTYACRLADKAYQRGHRVYCHTDSEQDTHRLDDLLWTFTDNSFIPHNIVGEGPNPPPPVQIGHKDLPSQQRDILINLSTNVPENFKRFQRVIEIVPDDEAEKAASRERYKHYRSQGFTVNTHHLS